MIAVYNRFYAEVVMCPPPDKKSIFSFSNVTSVISLVISISGTIATAYYNFFWHPEQL
jgi:hypothetical protein